MKTGKVLILYPCEFNVQNKFTRKVSKILQSFDEVEVQFINDEKALITNFVEQFDKNISIKKISTLEEADFTHAIVFDDGEVFSRELEFLSEKNIPTRFIKIAITRVVNIQRETQYANQSNNSSYEYIGRGSYWGNPYSMYEEGDEREEVIRKYKYDFDYDKFPKKDKTKVFELSGKRLGCFCKPYPCHGDVLADFLNSYDDGQ